LAIAKQPINEKTAESNKRAFFPFPRTQRQFGRSIIQVCAFPSPSTAFASFVDFQPAANDHCQQLA
jgi:hypothetical protein